MGPIERGEQKRYLLEFRDESDQLASLAGVEVEVRMTTRAGEIVKANTAGGGGDDEVEAVSTGIVRLKLTSSDTANMATGLVRGQVWITSAGEGRRLVGGFTTNVF
jgi:hypothetical protein